MSRPRPRRTVVAVAAATLGGFLVIDVVGAAVFPGEEYAAPAAIRPVPARRTGQVGGLVPRAELEGRSGQRNARDLRPAVLMLVPYPCDCLARLQHVVGQTDGSKVRLYLVGFTGRPQVDDLTQTTQGGAVPMVDRAGVLQRVYQPGPTGKLVLVRRDGVVTDIVDGVTTETDVRSRLGELLEVP